MKEPKKIPLTDSPRINEPKKIRLTSYPESMLDDLWEKIDNQHAPPIFVKLNSDEDNRKNNKKSLPELDS